MEKGISDIHRRAKQDQEGKWQSVLNNGKCPTGITIEFVKAESLKDSLAQFSDTNNILMAFDLDGTLNDMKLNDTANTLEVLRGAAKEAEKVVITAAPLEQCSRIVLPDVQHPAPDDTQNEFKKSFGFRNGSCEEHRYKDGTPIMVTHGISMAKYEKGEAIDFYLNLSSDIRGNFPEPRHIIFYDDFVINADQVANYFCFGRVLPTLAKISLVWYATPRAKDKSDRIHENLLNALTECKPGLDIKSLINSAEDSYLSLDSDSDAKLYAIREVFFEGAAREVTPVATGNRHRVQDSVDLPENSAGYQCPPTCLNPVLDDWVADESDVIGSTRTELQNQCNRRICAECTFCRAPVKKDDDKDDKETVPLAYKYTYEGMVITLEDECRDKTKLSKFPDRWACQLCLKGLEDTKGLPNMMARGKCGVLP